MALKRHETLGNHHDSQKIAEDKKFRQWRNSEYSLGMNSLFFSIQHRRSLHTLRIHYGIEGMKYIVQMYEGEVNGHGEREGLPTEYQYEFEQEMLKHIHKLKQELSEKGWSQKESPEVFQTSFLRSEESDAQLGFQFE